MITENKRGKEHKLYSLINRTITLDCRRNDISKEDFAHDIGTELGYLKQKLKPSVITNDLNLSEFIHIMELTGDLSPLEYVVNMFDRVMVQKQIQKAKATQINFLCDMSMMESNDVFSTTKRALKDEELTLKEQENILKEIVESEVALAKLKSSVQNAQIVDEKD